MTENQRWSISWRSKALDFTSRFTKEEQEKCSKVTESSLTKEDATSLIKNLKNIETWKKMDSEEFLEQWVKNAKSIIERIRV